MTDERAGLPEPYAGSLRVIDHQILRSYFQETSRWIIGESLGDLVEAARLDEVAEEIAVILAGGFAPALTTEIVRNTEKVIADSQGEQVTFEYFGTLSIGGVKVQDVIRLLDAVGALVDNGIDDAIRLLHDSHQRALHNAHDVWLAKQA